MADPEAAAAAAMAAAVRDFNTELWTLYAFGVAITILRTYARVKAVGFGNLQADDFIIWLAIVRLDAILFVYDANQFRSYSTPPSQL